MMKECKIHGNTEHAKRKDNGKFRCKKCMVDSVQKRRKELRQRALEYKGGKCENCGYNRCSDALEYHHLDPTQKDFNISKFPTPSWIRLKKEIEKCILLCSNCHKEEHARLRNIDI